MPEFIALPKSYRLVIIKDSLGSEKELPKMLEAALIDIFFPLEAG
jgi:hypothetical protein